MDKKYEEVQYTNVSGFEASYQKFSGTNLAEIELKTIDDTSTINGKVTYTVSEAYRTIAALTKVLQAHDSDFQEKMFVAMGDKKEEIL